MIFTMVQLAFTWCLHVPRMCSKQVLSRNHRSSIGETSWCDFLAMLVCGVPCGRTSPYQSWCNYRGCLYHPYNSIRCLPSESTYEIFQYDIPPNLYIYIYIYIYILNLCMYVYMYICTYVFTYIYIYVCVSYF